MKIVLLGIQGAGKSTQGNLLSKQLSLPYLSTGHIFREIAKEKTELGRYVKEMINAGSLIPDEKTIDIVTTYLDRKEYSHGFILDGFPRTLTQAKSFSNVDKVFQFVISDQEALWRLAHRDEVRDDNTIQAIKKRIELFHTFTTPVVNYYEKQDKILIIDGQKSIEEVNNEVLKSLGKQIVKDKLENWKQTHKIMIAVVGMSGSGKTEAVAYLKEKGLPSVSFGKIINDKVIKEFGEHTIDNHKKMRKQIRQDYGMAAMAVLSKDKIKEYLQEHTIVVIDGLYSWSEYWYLKEVFPDAKLYLVAITIDKDIRYERIRTRKERNTIGLEERDLDEINFAEKAQPIAFADYYILNNSTLDVLHHQLERIYRKIYFS